MNEKFITANKMLFTEKKQKYVGFPNLGNTCYLYFFMSFLKKFPRNSILQSLLHHTSFSNIFLNLPKEKKFSDIIISITDIINLKLQRNQITAKYLATILKIISYFTNSSILNTKY